MRRMYNEQDLVGADGAVGQDPTELFLHSVGEPTCLRSAVERSFLRLPPQLLNINDLVCFAFCAQPSQHSSVFAEVRWRPVVLGANTLSGGLLL